MSKRVLILCTGNSCRSQMAEYIWNQLGGSAWVAHSAGSHPAGYVHPLAIEVMKEVDQDLSAAESKHADQFVNEPIDLVITVCDSAKENCPVFASARESLHWPFRDPADAQGSDEEKRVVFRNVRDQIKQRIEQYLESSA